MAARRKRYVQVGVGGRSYSYTVGLVKTMARESELVGICDTNQGRMDLRNRKIVDALGGRPVPTYLDTQFERMIREQKPDEVIVTPPDALHDRYIIRAMELGCNVISEKPMTTDEKKCRAIVDAIRRTRRNLRITFNCRYMPPMMQVKTLLMKGVIGKILSVELQWLLDVSHGADYFRRWHREKRYSGGLLIHKATHHFDLVNWFLSASPVDVFARGTRSFYGAQSGSAERLGLKGHADRCLDCRCRAKCKFALDLKARPGMKAMYLDNEKYDGYLRDRCVFGKTMDIEDTMNLVVRYDSGAILSYSLNAFLPWEGFHFAFNGTRGRLEFDQIHPPIGSDKKVGKGIPDGHHIRIYPLFKPAQDIPVTIGHGGHGGGDDRLMQDLFSAKPKPDPLMRAADYASGAMSVLIGVAGNNSMRSGKPVRISDLVPGLPKPKLPPMKGA